MSTTQLQPPREVQKILVVALDNLGDLVFASALVPPLHAAFPHATIDIWCKDYTAPVAWMIPHVNDVIAADPFWAVPPHRQRPPLMKFLRSVADVRQRGYDVAVLSEAPWRAAAATAAGKIPTRIGLARHRNAAFLTHVLEKEDHHKPVVQEQARLLAPLGIAGHHAVYRLDETRIGESVADVERHVPARFVAFHPFASVRDRCVPVAEWTRLADFMAERSLPVVWVGTSAELNEFRETQRHPPGFYSDQIGDGSLRVTAAALSRATLFAGHDSGPLHVAAAFGVPVVGVFAPGQPDRTFPQGPGPWRIIRRPSPAGITASTMLTEIDAVSAEANR
ncbi:MAG: glycosyltransferase family 9 protein [Gemmatimonadaceae bacterium]